MAKKIKVEVEPAKQVGVVHKSEDVKVELVIDAGLPFLPKIVEPMIVEPMIEKKLMAANGHFRDGAFAKDFALLGLLLDWPDGQVREVPEHLYRKLMARSGGKFRLMPMPNKRGK